MKNKRALIIVLMCGWVSVLSLYAIASNEPPDDTYGKIGDVDRSGKIDIDDVTYLISFIFNQGPPPYPLCTGDVDDSGGADIDDVIYIIQYIFVGGAPPLSLGSVIPKVVYCACSDGDYTLSPHDTVWVQSNFGEALAVGQYLAAKLSPATGYDIQVLATLDLPTSGIVLRTSESQSSLGDEGYKITTTSDVVLLEAFQPAGLFRGIQTIRQLLPNEIEDSIIHEGPWVIPGGYILDYPNFKWRGFLLDVSRHFFTAETVKEYIDLLAYYKMNIFHWHLTDDQGWRPESDSFPLLNEIGSWRGEDNYGGYYTKEEMLDVVQYATARYIDVIPEIEMPGHATAAVASYPDLMCHPPEGDLVVPENEGVYNTIFCGGQDYTLDFLRIVMDEIVEVFPAGVIHIGGDEAVKDRWDICPYCQGRIEALNLADEHALQEWFMKEMAWYMYITHNRNISGWSEGGACQDDMPPGSQCQWWAPGDDIATLVENGYDVVNTYFGDLYLNNWYCTLPRMYQYDITGGADPAYYAHILGAEAALFTEFVETESQLGDEVFPRIIAVAENVWTRSGEKNYKEFYLRLIRKLECLNYMGIDYGSMEE